MSLELSEQQNAGLAPVGTDLTGFGGPADDTLHSTNQMEDTIDAV
jgi:hypothetical protein